MLPVFLVRSLSLALFDLFDLLTPPALTYQLSLSTYIARIWKNRPVRPE